MFLIAVSDVQPLAIMHRNNCDMFVAKSPFGLHPAGCLLPTTSVYGHYTNTSLVICVAMTVNMNSEYFISLVQSLHTLNILYVDIHIDPIVKIKLHRCRALSHIHYLSDTANALSAELSQIQKGVFG